MAKEIPCFELNTGAKIPSVGLGTWQSEPGLVGQAVETAIKVGYRHIDCARVYGNEKELFVLKRVPYILKTLTQFDTIPDNFHPTTILLVVGWSKILGCHFLRSFKRKSWPTFVDVPHEADIGSVLKKLFDDGVVKREELFITSKLWCADHAPEDVPVGLDKTLEELQLDYLDLYLIHWPVRRRKGSVGFSPEDLVPVDIPNTWKAMEVLYDTGKARAIGVSNFSTKKLGDLLDVARIPPAVDQVECHPSWQQTKLRELCKSKGVHLCAYSPLGSPGTVWIKSDVLKHPVIVTTAEKLGKTPAQVAIRWGLQMGQSVLPKSTNETRIKENFDVFNWSIPDDLFAKFSKIDQARLLRGSSFVHEKFGSYKTVEDLWDGEL